MKILFRLLAAGLIITLCGCSSTKANNESSTASTDFSRTTTQAETQATTQASAVQTEPVEITDEDFVKIKDYIPNIYIDLPYATENNFTGKRIYDFTEPLLRYGTVKKLIQVQNELAAKGLSLKIWDAFRPVAAQFKLWEIYPDASYVSDPNRGYSSHSRGNTVDVTLVNADGTEIVMPTGFDDFSPAADRDYSDCSPQAAKNAMLLEQTMKKHGFRPYQKEWWHFTDTESYPVDENFD